MLIAQALRTFPSIKTPSHTWLVAHLPQEFHLLAFGLNAMLIAQALRQYLSCKTFLAGVPFAGLWAEHPAHSTGPAHFSFN